MPLIIGFMSACFIIMPISTPLDRVQVYGDTDHFNHVLDHLFLPVVKEAGYRPVPPVAEGADIIHARIVKALEESDMVLCDMSGLNANVFFELGIRTAVDKPVCLVADDKTEKIPFDTGIINFQRYASALRPWNLATERAKLLDHLKKSAETSKEHNTMWNYFGLSSRAVLKPGETGPDAKVDMLFTELQALRNQLAGEESKSETPRSRRTLPCDFAAHDVRQLFKLLGVASPVIRIQDNRRLIVEAEVELDQLDAVTRGLAQIAARCPIQLITSHSRWQSRNFPNDENEAG